MATETSNHEPSAECVTRSQTENCLAGYDRRHGVREVANGRSQATAEAESMLLLRRCRTYDERLPTGSLCHCARSGHARIY